MGRPPLGTDPSGMARTCAVYQPGRGPGTHAGHNDVSPLRRGQVADGKIGMMPTPWSVTPGTRMTLGLGAEWLGVFRVEAGYGVQSHDMRVAFDVSRDFWPIL